VNDLARTSPPVAARALFGSDAIAGLLRELGFEYIALTPGASFRGLHDSLVNHLGNERPKILLCVHEESAVAMAHGYARVTGRPMAVALHANVGLMHATMAIFNAWCDRVPVFMLGGVGPMDAARRRPWVDWIHTSRDMGALIRGYTKWDDQPASIPAALESVIRAHRIATTLPCGPVYVNLDASLQEEPLAAALQGPSLAFFPQPVAGDPPAETVTAIVSALRGAERPLFMFGRMSIDEADFARRVALAERVGAIALTDIKTGATFPTRHTLHPYPPSLYIGDEAGAAIREADVIVSFDWIDVAGAVRQACAGEWPQGRLVHCSLDPYVHNGWSMDYQALPATAMSLLAPPDRLVSRLLDAWPDGQRQARAPWRSPQAPEADGGEDAGGDPAMSIHVLARTIVDMLAPHRPSYVRLPLGWPGDCALFAHPKDYIGFDGGGGIGSGPGMAVGSALALRGSGRLPVAVLGDGDYLMGLTALWTAVHHRVPLLVVVANNQSFFNDELHQERMARVRGRPVANRSIGIRMGEPGMDLAKLAEGQGAVGYGPATTAETLVAMLAAAVTRVQEGAVCVVDARVRPEYARNVASALMRPAPEKR
jgi:thiamine pyrophosphate-dependent acetolactate synthase large subunit-like protein